MSFYLPFYFIIFLLAWFVKDKRSDMLIVFLLLFFSMFRGDNVGVDTAHYLAGFTQREFDLSSGSVYNYEFLFIWFENRLEALKFGTRYIIYLFSIITFYFLVKSSKRFNVSISLVCLFYVLFNYYFLSLNIARQFAAAAILLYAFSYLQYEDKRRQWFFVYVILAGGLHVTSLFFIVLYFSRYFDVGKINKQYIIIFLIAFYVVSLFWIAKLIYPIINILGNFNQYVEYLEQTKVMIVSLKSIIFTTSMIIIKSIIFIQLRKEGANKTLLNLFFISILVDAFFINLWGNMARIKYSMGMIDLICYAYYFKQNRLSSNKLIIFTLTMIVYGYILIWILYSQPYSLEIKFY
jgi:transmembrane protein EpsG